MPLLLLACGGQDPLVIDDPPPQPSSPALPEEAAPPARADLVTPTYRDGFGPSSTVADFEALAVRRRGPHGPAWVMKVLLEDLDTDAPRAMFVDTRQFETHWWFARALLGDAWNEHTFANRTYKREPRPAAALDLVLHEGLSLWVESIGAQVEDPISVEMAEEDRISPQMALRLLGLLNDRIAWAGPTRHRLLWMAPDAAREVEAAEAFAAGGVGWVRRQELLADLRMQILNPGVAFGTLRRIPVEELDHAVVSSHEILVLPRAPNELPVVAGVITETLQTPLSHVAIASRARGTPDLALIDAGRDPKIVPLLGSLVRLEVTVEGWDIRVAEPAEAEAFWAAGRGPALVLPEAELARTALLPLDGIGFSDSRAVGVKAANVAELRHLLGEGAPDGFAVPFSWAHDFMRARHVSQPLCRDAFADCVEEGRARSLCEGAQARCTAGALAGLDLHAHSLALLADPEVLADPALREAVLDGLRYQIGHQPLDPDRAATLDAEVVRRWGGTRIRLRSSTNCEDLPDFSGAGLYRSVWAQEGVKEASTRIQQVWASVWSFRAVEERAAWGIDHAAVEVGVLVHPATVGETANGVVVTADLSGDRPAAVTMNLNAGDSPVTNPEPGMLPEQVVAWQEGEALRIERVEAGTAGPVLSDAEIAQLYAIARRIQAHFAPLYGRSVEALALDLEIKRTDEGALFVKQARPYPRGGQ